MTWASHMSLLWLYIQIKSGQVASKKNNCTGYMAIFHQDLATKVEKKLATKVGHLSFFFLRFQGLKDSSQIVASNVGHLGQPWLAMEYWWLVASLVVSNFLINSSET